MSRAAPLRTRTRLGLRLFILTTIQTLRPCGSFLTRTVRGLPGDSAPGQYGPALERAGKPGAQTV